MEGELQRKKEKEMEIWDELIGSMRRVDELTEEVNSLHRTIEGWKARCKEWENEKRRLDE